MLTPISPRRRVSGTVSRVRSLLSSSSGTNVPELLRTEESMTQTCLGRVAAHTKWNAASTGIRWHAACAQDGPKPLPRRSAALRLDQGTRPAYSRLGGPGPPWTRCGHYHDTSSPCKCTAHSLMPVSAKLSLPLGREGACGKENLAEPNSDSGKQNCNMHPRCLLLAPFLIIPLLVQPVPPLLATESS